MTGGRPAHAVSNAVSSVQEKLYLTATGRRNGEVIDNILKEAGIPVIKPGFKATDDDFPDLWHLRGSRNAEFTRSVAAAYLDVKKISDNSQSPRPAIFLSE